ncbi:bifunctional homocysteine S-methyltransferase/methylenetetrahydrofolate reductase [Candidatus Caldatribacterium sp.]|uniref:bifunctional homocysteine S-methyltransferase/methylenetetrahydrofolate reductase n=1 Tax=Candidatus Caldatribacterium sp. TaxID=2282143 RepID=UPI00299C91AE|nr:bifunctional homocysteine S-methyltransferase/methylenetetrahydrofolate reductase [Candidatus Caldatribacterium sp.]MDW8081053.1 bifunctional homocysteine S-methyltransferase/methylenetetrahydrofolate reductase [Candidatus Calescibacterium sp.]
MQPFREFLKAVKVCLCDGAMGTELLRRGYPKDTPLELANLTAPELVAEIHEAYLSSGAKLLETNTFGANRVKLSHFGFEEQVSEIIRRGVQIARSVAEGKAYLLGSVGPLGKPVGVGLGIEDAKAKEAYREQIGALLDAGVDAVLLETMASVREVEIALEALRSLSGDVSYIVQFSFLPGGVTHYGESLAKVLAFLKSLDACGVGINCGSGPHEALSVLREFSRYLPGPFSVQPNAGYPQIIQGRMVFGASPEYFASFAGTFVRLGAKILGGCCGTTPEHIRALAQAVEHLRDEAVIEVVEEERETITLTSFPPSSFREKLGKRFVFTVEINPPKGTDLEKVKEGVRRLQEAQVDAVNISDSPMARVRISPIALAHILREELGMESIVHFTCRDRNLISLQSELLGAAALGVQNILALTGDPPSVGDHPFARPVFEVNSEGLVLILNRLNSGFDFAGNPLGRATNFTIGVALNLNAQDLEREIDRLRRKIDNGAHFILTQPIYEPEVLEQFLAKFREPLPPILGGILPLRSFRHAEFLHNEVPGIVIPEHLRLRMACAQDPVAEGVAIALEIATKIRPLVAGIYIMPPFERYDMAIALVESIRKGVDTCA